MLGMSNITLTGQVSKKYRYTRHEHYLSLLNVNLTVYQKGMYHAGLKNLRNLKTIVKNFKS